MTTSFADATGAPVEPLPEGDEARIVGRTPWQLFWARFLQDRFALAGLAFILLLVLTAIAAPAFAAITGHGPNELFQRQVTDVFGIPEGPTVRLPVRRRQQRPRRPRPHDLRAPASP